MLARTPGKVPCPAYTNAMMPSTRGAVCGSSAAVPAAGACQAAAARSASDPATAAAAATPKPPSTDSAPKSGRHTVGICAQILEGGEGGAGGSKCVERAAQRTCGGQVAGSRRGAPCLRPCRHAAPMTTVMQACSANDDRHAGMQPSGAAHRGCAHDQHVGGGRLQRRQRAQQVVQVLTPCRCPGGEVSVAAPGRGCTQLCFVWGRPPGCMPGPPPPPGRRLPPSPSTRYTQLMPNSSAYMMAATRALGFWCVYGGGGGGADRGLLRAGVTSCSRHLHPPVCVGCAALPPAAAAPAPAPASPAERRLRHILVGGALRGAGHQALGLHLDRAADHGLACRSM